MVVAQPFRAARGRQAGPKGLRYDYDVPVNHRYDVPVNSSNASAITFVALITSSTPHHSSG
jgi:hypothetical protein